MAFTKFIHVMAGVTLLGLCIASFFYISHSIAQKKTTLVKYALTTSFFADLMITVLIPLLFATGHFLVVDNHLSLATPWVKMAYLALSLVSLGWLSNLVIKWINYSRSKSGQVQFKLHRSYCVLNIAMIILLMIIIHDAVLEQTFIWIH